MSASVEQYHTQAVQDMMNGQKITDNSQSSATKEREPSVVKLL